MNQVVDLQQVDLVGAQAGERTPPLRARILARPRRDLGRDERLPAPAAACGVATTASARP